MMNNISEGANWGADTSLGWPNKLGFYIPRTSLKYEVGASLKSGGRNQLRYLPGRAATE